MALTVKFIPDLCELDNVWKDPDKIESSKLITKCFNSLVERYINFWQDRISNDESCCPNRLQSNGGNKLRTYKLLKSDYKMEPTYTLLETVKSGETLQNYGVAIIPC